MHPGDTKVRSASLCGRLPDVSVLPAQEPISRDMDPPARLVLFRLASMASGQPNTNVVATLGNRITLTGDDVTRLVSNDWLNGSILSNWATLLNQFSPDDVFVSETYLWPKLINYNDAERFFIKRTRVRETPSLSNLDADVAP